MSSKNRPDPKLTHPSRRQMLGMMTAAAAGTMAFDPVRSLIGGLVDGAIAKAQADTGIKPPRNYLYVAFPSGPCRWHWDLPLAPYAQLSNSNYTYPTASLNGGIANRFNGASSLTPEYATVVVTAPKSGVKLRMPHIWGWTIPTTSGVWVPMANLLDHMMFIRGLTSLDGHADSQLIQVRPRAGSPSVDGAVADRSKRPVPAIALAGSPSRVFASAKGGGNVRIEDLSTQSNPLQRILAPFERAPDNLPGTYLSRRDAMNSAIQRGLAALGAEARSNNPAAQALWTNQSTAENMLRKGVGNVSAVYSTLLRKYQTLVALCANEHLLGNAAGITDRSLDKSRMSADQYSNGSIAPLNNSITSMFQYDPVNPGNGTGIPGLPESFAIAEYLFINGYSSTLIAGCGGVNGLYVPGFTPWGWDEHGAGLNASITINSFAFRAVAACLNELVGKLSAAGIFDETVIHLGGEFSRSPRNDLKGSDHSPNGNAISLISGAIRQPFVIGNTQPDTDPMHAGNYGIGDVTKLDGGLRTPSVGNQSSTLAFMLRVSPPMSNDASLVTETTSGIVPVIELAKNRGES